MKMEIKSTTILGVRVGKDIALGGDGQVTLGDMQLKLGASVMARYWQVLLVQLPMPWHYLKNLREN